MNGDRILQGDCREVLKEYPDNFFDSICTDPPYELAFMGKKWDASGIAYDPKVWSECLRVLKPGGHLLAFGGTRTYHRMACAIEDAGFEIRDMIEWVYASGFPKSLDISKALDKMAGAEREVIGTRKASLGILDHGREAKYKREGILTNDITAPSTPAAKQWAGFGSAIKPAHESICLARKPLSEPTIAANVIKWGCGVLNVDGCRIESDGDHKRPFQPTNNDREIYGKQTGFQPTNSSGRFPANLIHDGSPAVLAEFAKAGDRKCGNLLPHHKTGTVGNIGIKPRDKYNGSWGGDSGSASRFFQACEWGPEDVPAFVYEAKASRGEREKGLDGMPIKQRPGLFDDDNYQWDESKGHKIAKPTKNSHPTIKPLSLMRYLCRLITPPGGLVLDPFAGSGTTLLAARQENMHYVGVELQAEYVAIARKRLAAVPASLDRWGID